ncbi:RNA polymerase sigma-70 factor [Pedobacter sp. ASV1-7]|uniref:RNA polymerase sigma-70 factor n=1 Tax=Pedobacter sp. ASV1-7 TaxID=3145237 RepID=UPI0032E8D139
MRNLKKLSDMELCALLVKSDNQAFEEIFNRYWSVLYSAAYKRLKSHEKTEEIVQDLFTLLWSKRENIQIHTSLSGYLLTTVRYLVLNHFQKESVRESYKNSLDPAHAYDNSTEDTILFNDLKRNLEKEVNNLPPQCRSVYELSRNQHIVNHEIAALLSISEKTVEGHLTKAIKRLKVRLKTHTSSIIIIVITFF